MNLDRAKEIADYYGFNKVRINKDGSATLTLRQICTYLPNDKDLEEALKHHLPQNVTVVSKSAKAVAAKSPAAYDAYIVSYTIND